MRLFQLLIQLNIFIISLCHIKEAEKSKNLLPSFRKLKEEVEETTVKTTENDEPRSNLVEFLVENVKEIFKGLPASTEPTGTDNVTEATGFFLRQTLISTSDASISIRPTRTNYMMLFENLSLATLVDTRRFEAFVSPGDLYGVTGRHELLHLSKGISYDKPYTKKELDIAGTPSDKLNGPNTSEVESDLPDPRRSCIACDNVKTEDCANPSNKLIPSVLCEREDDLCYSQHTPFGIIVRGCFNVNHNLTTYVCSCNLCNYISISEMPYIFSNKRDWVDNVIELSRTKHFRKSVFKDMSCLRCEVNVTTKRGDMLDSANCLEGNVGNLPTQECEENEICGVQTIKSQGYVWRGCVKAPLYNYWWALCDTDLCNYDTLVSIYDLL